MLVRLALSNDDLNMNGSLARLGYFTKPGRVTQARFVALDNARTRDDHERRSAKDGVARFDLGYAHETDLSSRTFEGFTPSSDRRCTAARTSPRNSG